MTQQAQRWRQVYFEPSLTEPATATGYSLGYSAGNGGSVMNPGSNEIIQQLGDCTFLWRFVTLTFLSTCSFKQK